VAEDIFPMLNEAPNLEETWVSGGWYFDTVMCSEFRASRGSFYFHCCHRHMQMFLLMKQRELIDLAQVRDSGGLLLARF
jgi:hypothetical protein